MKLDVRSSCVMQLQVVLKHVIVSDDVCFFRTSHCWRHQRLSHLPYLDYDPVCFILSLEASRKCLNEHLGEDDS